MAGQLTIEVRLANINRVKAALGALSRRVETGAIDPEPAVERANRIIRRLRGEYRSGWRWMKLGQLGLQLVATDVADSQV